LGPDKPTFAPNQLFFLGGLDWLPNQEGMRWFMDECWPLLQSAHPHWQLHIAGRNMPEWMMKWKSEWVQVHGSVPDAVGFMSNHGVMLVPLFSGSGMRIKIIEALAQGIPLVATTLAVEGISVEADKHLLIADTPDKFVQAIEVLESDEALRLRLREEGMKLVKNDYYYISVAQKVLSKYEHYLAVKTLITA
jgi:glycosyltransferase involved in cell wall biosynthesis